jgi:endogenous inhibitor of DNA gyrase (YacG/DUF329 family)
MAKVKCPTCETAVEWGPQSLYRPFCSKRCRLIDLGGWLDGSNAIPGEELEGEQLTQLERNQPPANEEFGG